MAKYGQGMLVVDSRHSPLNSSLLCHDVTPLLSSALASPLHHRALSLPLRPLACPPPRRFSLNPRPRLASPQSTRSASALALSLSHLQSVLLPTFACHALSLSSVPCPCPFLPPRSPTPAVPPRVHAATSLASTLYPPRTPPTRRAYTLALSHNDRRLSSVALSR